MKVLKLFGGAIVATVVFLIAIWAMLVVVRFFSCGTNSTYINKDVKIMKPMAEKISSYIVKNGIPESLKGIPNLPYKLEGCEENKWYSNMVNGYMQKVPKEEAKFYNFREVCNYLSNKLQFDIQTDIKESSREIILRMDSEDKTYIDYRFEAKKGNQPIIYLEDIGSNKGLGWCIQFNQ